MRLLICADRPDAAAIEAGALALLQHGELLGDRYSVGHTHTPAGPASHEWAVTNLQGMPVALCHDAFEAVRWFVYLDAGACDEPETTILDRSDSEIEAANFQERNSYAFWMMEQPAPDPGHRAAVTARFKARLAARRGAR